jgi:uncharacterized membrane protein (UPF0127 family)
VALLDVVFGLFLLPAAIMDSLTQSPVEFQGEPAVINGRNFTLYRAGTPDEWQHGFKSHDVTREEAMLFEFPDAGRKMFWMRGTVTPLDIVFLDDDYRVVNVHENASPCGLFCRPYFGTGRYVLELRAGMARELGIEQNKTVAF